MAHNRFQIFGRVSEAVTLPTGAVVFPTSLEASLEACPSVQHAFCHVVLGAVGVVVVPSPHATIATDDQEKWLALVQGVLKDACAVRGVVIAPSGPWTAASGYVNGMGKKCRAVLVAAFQPALTAALIPTSSA